jgi:hypothetical protein
MAFFIAHLTGPSRLFPVLGRSLSRRVLDVLVMSAMKNAVP